MNRHPKVLLLLAASLGACSWAALRGDREIRHAGVEAGPEFVHDVPRAQTPQHGHDFGTVEPLHTYRHTFEIHNVGDAPLRLAKVGTSCKCLNLEVLDEQVAPGATGRVLVSWAAQIEHLRFLQRVTIETNDPDQKLVELQVAGQARLTLAADPPELSLPRIKPNRPAEVSTRIVSQTWDEFTVDEVTPSLDGVTWSLAPIEPDELHRRQAKSGWLLSVKLPPDLPEGPFTERIRLTARPAAGDEPVEREIALKGKVLRRLAVYGQQITPWGTIEAGSIDAQSGYEAKFLVRTHDEEAVLRVTKIAAEPSFIQARLTPYQPPGAPGLYRLHVRIPPDALPGVYQGDRQGNITLSFDHPRIDSLKLGIEFVVPKARHDLHRKMDVAMTAER